MSEPRNVLVIANPTSGRGRGARTAHEVAARLRARGTDVVLRFTEHRGDGEGIAAAALGDSAHRPNVVVACGGDGTIQEIANALVSSKDRTGQTPPPMALAPSGRCNDFARVLGIRPRVDSIVAAIVDGTPRAVDLGRANGRHFCTVATAGIDAEVTEFVDRMRMPLTRTPAYVYGALRVLARFKPHRVRIEGEFGRIECPIFIASTANTSSYGGAIPIAPSADPTDGLLDVCVIRYMSRLKALAMIPRVLRGRHASHPQVTMVRTRRYTLESDSPLQLWADGEPIAKTPTTIEIAPAAITVYTPRAVAQ